VNYLILIIRKNSLFY